MHVSLPRRFCRVGHAKPFLLWLGFGVLAVVPWQVLCGQDQPTATVVEQQADDPGQEGDDSTRLTALQTEDKSVQDPVAVTPPGSEAITSQKSPEPSLIFRGQSPPMAMSPLQIDPQSRNPEVGDPGFFGSDMITGRTGQSLGNMFRVGGFTGPAIGRKVSIFPIEWMPYSLIDNNLFFADIRAFRGTTDNWGTNLGGGYRRYIPSVDRIFGVNAYFDYDNTSGSLFRQVGFGAEWLGALYDVRGNAYLPTGNSAEQISLVNVDGTQKFVGHNLLVSQQRTILNALHGFDGEIGVPIPGTIPQRHDLRVFGGGYWYEGTDISSFGGWKTRVQAHVIPSVQLQLEVTHDQQFKTNVVFGGSWSYGGFRQNPEDKKTQYDRMTTPVIRNYNMIVGTTFRTDENVAVVNPDTNQPYFFEHVASYAPSGGDGTVERPFKVFADAQTAPLPDGVSRDIIFVHAGSVFSGVGVNLQEDVRVLGESSAVDHAVNTIAQNSNSNLGTSLFLPHPTSGALGAIRPVFQDAPGDGVVLASRSEFSGFDILRPTGRGIFGDGIVGSTQYDTVRQTNVSLSGEEGVFLNNTLGVVSFRGNTINDPIGNATTFHVSGTRGTVLFTSDSQGGQSQGVINNVTGNGGMALLVEGTLIGSNVDFTGSTVNDTTGNGILFRDDAGTVTLGNANISSSLGSGLSILNNSGLVTTNGALNINGAAGDSIVVEDLALGGIVRFVGTGAANSFDVNVSNRLARGIYLNNNAGNVVFSTGVEVNAASNLGPAAIEYQGSSGSVSFNTIVINRNLSSDLSGAGILIGRTEDDNTGSFIVNGNTTINNTAGTAIQVTDDRSNVSFANALNAGTTTINQRGNIGIQVLANHGPVTFNGTTNINNENLATQPAIDIRRNTVVTDAAGTIISSGSVIFNTVNIEGAAGPAASGVGVGVNIGGLNEIDANPALVNFNLLNIGNLVPVTNGTALFVANEGQGTGNSSTGLTIGGGTINAIGGTAVDIRNSDINVRLTSVSSAPSATLTPAFGISLIDNRAINQPTIPQLDSFMFQVSTPTSTALSQLTGGNIRGASIAGVNLVQTAGGGQFQTGGVSLNNMTIQSNTIGIRAENLLQLNVWNSNISNNVGNLGGELGAGIDAANIPRIDIQNSQFTLNGTASTDHAIYLHTNVPLLLPPAALVNSPTNGRYLWNVSNNSNLGVFNGGFTGQAGTGDLVRVEGSLTGGGDLQYTINTIPIQTFSVPLVFQFVNNSMNVQQDAAGVAVNWTGQIDASSTATTLISSISGNSVILNGGGTAISIANPTTVYSTNFLINSNLVTANSGFNTGLFVNNFSQTNLSIGNGAGNGNNFTFVTPFQNTTATFIDTGMSISITNATENASFVTLANNTITMTGGPQNQGMIFPNTQAPATFIFNNNLISIANAQPIIGQAIDFVSISNPTVVLGGTISNTVLINGSTSTAFQNAWFNRQPANSTVGQIIINGFAGP